MAGIEISKTRTQADLKAFGNLPWRIYQGDPNWAPPIRKKIRELVDSDRHPFWKFSERELFLARRGGNTVGRIAAIIDHNHNERFQEKTGGWGFFESHNDPEAAVGLFWAAEEWFRERGMLISRGPLNPSLNYEAGLLVKGFDLPSAVMLPYNPAYYAGLIYACGYSKEKDLWSFRIPREYQPPAWAYEISRQIAGREEFSIRVPGRAKIESELLRLNALFARCWKDNWGFVPMTADEMSYAAKDLLQLVDPEFSFFICRGDQEIGVFLTILDVNPFLKRLNGEIDITAVLKKALYWSEIRGRRVLLFGILEEFRDQGAPMVVFEYLMNHLKAKTKLQYIEAGWTLEDNHGINHIFKEGGLHPCRVLRVFKKKLTG